MITAHHIRKALGWLLPAALILAAVFWGGNAHADRAIAPGTAEAKRLACTYNPPTLHGGQTYTVWDGPNGELVKVTNYIQRITSPDCGTSYRAATNWKATKNGSPANMGAELGHYVQDGGGNNYSITPYTCYTPGYPCFGSSGADGEHSTYSAWFAPWYSADFRGRISVSQVSVLGTISNANHVSQSGYVFHP